MNLHQIHGRLARDPELTRGETESKDRVNFTVATDRRFGDETDFFDCVLFGKRAGVISKYFSKGSEIMLYGEGQLRSYEDKNGVKKRSYSIVVADFDFCGKRNDGTNNNTGTTETAVKSQNLDDIGDSWEEADADIPF